MRAPRAIVIMRGAVAYSTGLEFDTDIVGRDDLDLREGLVFQLHQRVGLGRRIPRKLVRLGVAFADGRRATSLDFLSPAEPDGERAAALTLVCQRGGGSGRRWRLSWWLAPLPPEGPVTVECEWPWSEVPASRQTFDAGPLREAAERSERF